MKCFWVQTNLNLLWLFKILESPSSHLSNAWNIAVYRFACIGFGERILAHCLTFDMISASWQEYDTTFFVKLDFKHYKFKIQLILWIFSTKKENDFDSTFAVISWYSLSLVGLLAYFLFSIEQGGDVNKRLLDTGRAWI